MSNFNSINNNGVPYYFPADIAKEGQQYARFSNWLKTRVNDNGKIIPVKWYDQGRVMNVNGLTPFIQGMVGHFTTDENDELIPSADVVSRDWQGSPADVTDGGLAFYTLEDQFFCQEGQFKGVFGLRDNSGNIYTSVNIIFEILGNDLRMGETTKYYSSELEKMKAKFANDTGQAINDLHERYKNKAQKSEDTLDNIQKNMDTMYAATKASSTAAKNIQDQIDRQDIVTNARFDDVAKELTKSITNKLSQISSTIPWLKDADTIQATYPNGYSGAVIATDTMHKWLYYDGRWNDAGAYSETISKDGDIVAYLDEGKTLTWDPYSINCELDLSNMTTGLTIHGAVNVSFSKEDVYKAFSSSPYTKLNGNIVTGESFALVYYFSTNKLGVINPTNELATADSKILFLHHYKSVNDGLLINSKDAKLQFKIANAPFAYVAEGKDLSYDYSSNDCNLKFDGEWVEVYYDQVKHDVKVSDILEAARKSKVVTVTDDNVIKGLQFILYFDSKDGSVHFTDRESGVPIDGYTLFEHEYSSYTGGPLVDYHVNFQALKLLEFMQKYKNTIQNYKDTKEVPDYFKENLAEGIDRVNQNMGEAGPNSLSFLFITDIHWGGNLKKSPALVRQVMKKTGLPLMISGGDLFDQGEKDAMMQQATEAIGAIKQPGIFMANVFGNHDDNWNSWGGQRDHPERKFSYSDIYGYEFAYMMRDKKLVDDFHYLNLGIDFSYTFATTDASGQVWRFICVDTGNMTTGFNINQNSFNRIIDLLKKSENEKIIFIAHIFSNNHAHTSFEQDLEKVVDARNSLGVCTLENQSSDTLDFSQSSNTSKIIACFGGHEHEDYSWTSPGGVPFILTDSDNAPRTETKNFGHDAGTIGEQCFDIVTINPNAKTIKNVRIGRGIDRSFQMK